MSGAEFQECLDAMGLKQVQYAELAELSIGTVRKRKIEQANISPEVAILLRVLKLRPELMDLVWEVAGLPDGIEQNPQGRPPIRD